MIEVRNISKSYGSKLALDDVSFSLEEGKIYGLLGRNGAGKSTTMNIMTGYLEADGGDVLINGVSMMRDPGEAKKHIGYLPEIPPLYIDMTVKEYLFFAARLKKIPASEIKQQVARTVEFTGLQDVYTRLIRTLSKGYRQRVGLAYALLGFPEVIILDEPTVGIDPKQIAETRELIRSIGKEHTIVFSSHVLSEVQSLCDEILVINEGKLAARGTMEELEELCHAVTLTVKVKGGAEDALAAAKAAAGENSVSLAETAGETVTLNISGCADDSAREAVFRSFSAADLPILDMHSAEVGLEELFLQLTGGEEK